MGQFEEEYPKENRALIPFSDNLPYDRNRVIQEAKFCLQVMIAARFEVGKRLLILREHEGCATFAHILEEHFSGLKRRSAYNYMVFAKKAAELPKFQAWADGRGNFSKALALIQACEEEDLAEFEEGGDILGLKMDEIEKMSVKQLQSALRREREKREEEIKGATEATAAENAKLKDENKLLKEAMTEPGLKEFRKLIADADEKFHAGVQIMRKVNWEVVGKDWSARLEALQKLNLVQRAVDILTNELLRHEEPDYQED